MLVTESLHRDALRLMIWYPFRWLVHILPLMTTLTLFRLLGTIHYYLGRRGVRRIKRNIRRAFPDISDGTLRAHALDYMRNHYTDRLHILTYPKLKQGRTIENIIRLRGVEHLDRVLDLGRGAIIVLGHFGPIQLPLFALGARGYKVIQIGLPTDEGRSWIGKNVAFRLRLEYENMIPARIVSADRFLRPVFEHLSQNGVVMMNIDPAGGGRWIGRFAQVPFFGHTIPMALGSSQLSMKTGAGLLLLTLETDAENGYVAVVHPPIENASRDPNPLFQMYFEQIGRNPGLWHFWDEFEPGKLILDTESIQKIRPAP